MAVLMMAQGANNWCGIVSLYLIHFIVAQWRFC